MTEPGIANGQISLRHVLYEKLKLTDGHSLIGEVYKENILANIDILVPDIPESETMVAIMKKQLGDFLYYYLMEEVKMDKQFVMELLKDSIIP